MYFSPILSVTTLWLIAACAICILLMMAIYMFRLRSVAEYRRRADSERPDKPDSEYLPTSVIVYSQGDAENLNDLLRTLLAQNYPAAFEVIVVNEGESTDVRDVVSLLRAEHPNLYLTFTPEGVVNLSRKKLAITLGIKAARYDIVVLTTTSAIITSDQWLRHIMAPFSKDNGIEVVLGYAYPEPDEDEAMGRRRRSFDHIAESSRWIGTAIAGKPFRGTEFNLAYRKDLFTRSKGFSRTFNLIYGDDDIFISGIANRANTTVQLSEESMVRVRHGNHPRIFTERTLRRVFTEGFIRRRPRFLFGLAGWLQIAAVALAVLAGIASWPNLTGAIIALIMVFGMFAFDIWVWSKLLKALKGRRLRLTIPWFSATYPLRRTLAHIRARLGKQKKYTWD